MKMKKLVIIAILTLVISFLLDDLIFNFVDILSSINFLDVFLNWIFLLTNSFYNIILFAISIFLFFYFTKQPLKRFLVVIFGFIVNTIIAFLLKITIQRPRPFIEFGLEGKSSFYPWDTSFPSFHAMIAFFTMPFILQKNNKIIIVLWFILVFLVVFVRIYEKIHYFSDIVAGGLVGYSLGLLFIYLGKKKDLF